MFQESQNRVRSMALAERLYQPKDLARNGKFTLLVSDNGVGLLEDLDFRNTKLRLPK
jgi:two-component sensor histidine kinase